MANEVVNLAEAEDHIVATNALMGKIYAHLVAPPGVAPASDDPTVFAWMPLAMSVPEDILDYLGGFVPTGREIDVKAVAKHIEAMGIPPTDPEFRIEMAKAMNEERVAEVNERWMHASEVSKLCDMTPNLDIVFGENNDQSLMTLADNLGPMSAIYRQLLDEIEIAERPVDSEGAKQLAKLEALLYEPEARPPGALPEGGDPDPFGSMLSSILNEPDENLSIVPEIPRPSLAVRQYEEGRATYEAAVAEYTSKYREAQLSPIAANEFQMFAEVHRRRLREALRAWRSSGRKNQVEGWRSMMAHLTRADMATFVENARTLYDSDESAAQGGMLPFKYTAVIPSSMMSLPWQTIKFSFEDIKRYRQEVKKTGGGGFGISLPFWGAGGGGAASKDSVETSFDLNEINISFQASLNLIVRPWAKTELFDSHEWKLPGGQLLSDGKAVPSGRLRGYTDAILFIRDLTIEHSQLHRFYEMEKKKAGGRGGLRIGIFNLGGSGSRTTIEQTSGGHKTRTSFTHPGPAIAGFRCRRLPLLPNPDPNVDSWV